jgi:hypothetical protein
LDFKRRQPVASAFARELRFADSTYDLFEPLRKRIDDGLAGDMDRQETAPNIDPGRTDDTGNPTVTED